MLVSVLMLASCVRGGRSEVRFRPVGGLQQLLDDELEGGGQAVGAGLILVLSCVRGLVGSVRQGGEGLGARGAGGFFVNISFYPERLRLFIRRLSVLSCIQVL